MTFVTRPAAAPETQDVQRTTCCIVGGGPAGAVLALLLVRQGIPVTLLEAHKDFDREFRGDTVHPSTLEILDEIGLAERLHQLRHVKITTPTLRVGETSFTPIDFRRLNTRFPYMMLMHQPILLEFVTEEAAKYPNFRLVMQANVMALIEEGGEVRGVRYQSPQGWHEVRALLTVGADGRFSRVRQQGGFVPIKTSPPMDVLWFRLPRLPEDPPVTGGGTGGMRGGHIFAVLDRFDYWQALYIITKGHYREVRAAGLEALRRSIVEIEPGFAKHVEHLTDWQQFSLLSVEASRCPRWYKPGVLLIGDAAHVMSPVGGLGINYAIQDSVVAANVLAAPLKSGRVRLRDLAKVQRQREWPTRFIQGVQSLVQKRIVGGVLRSQEATKVPWYVRLFFRVPVLRDLPARIIALGIWRVHVRNARKLTGSTAGGRSNGAETQPQSDTQPRGSDAAENRWHS